MRNILSFLFFLFSHVFDACNAFWHSSFSRVYRFLFFPPLPSEEEVTAFLPNIVVKWLTLLLRIQEVPGSNLVPDTGQPD
jgi:hypothetical protein